MEEERVLNASFGKAKFSQDFREEGSYEKL